MVTRSVTVHYRLPVSSLPDLIRQSMTPRRLMDHRVKPGGDDQEARSATSSRNGELHPRLTCRANCGPRRHCERRKVIQPAAKSWIALSPRSSRRGLSRLDFWRKRLLQSAPTGATQKPPKASSGLILVFVVGVFINFEASACAAKISTERGLSKAGLIAAPPIFDCSYKTEAAEPARISMMSCCAPHLDPPPFRGRKLHAAWSRRDDPWRDESLDASGLRFSPPARGRARVGVC